MKVLFITFHFPPAYQVAVNRTFSIAKYLSAKGNEVHVLTVKKDHIAPEKREDFKNLCKKERIALYESSFLFPGLVREYFNITRINPLKKLLTGVLRYIISLLKIEPWIGWNPSAYKLGKKIVAGKEFDAIIASGGPFFSFLVAEKLMRRFDIPMVLDYRDLWTGDPTKKNRPWYIRNIEKRVLSKASAVVAIAPSMENYLAKTFSCRHTYCITNGYDGAILLPASGSSLNNEILYAGQLHQTIGGIEPFLSVFQHIENNEITFHYLGKSYKHVTQKCTEHGIMERCIIEPPVEREKALAIIGEARLVLVVLSNKITANETERGVLSGKLFELLGLGKHLLIIAPENSDVHQLLPDYKGIFSADQTKEMADYIRWIFNENPPEPGPNPKFDWRNLITQWETVLDKVVEGTD